MMEKVGFLSKNGKNSSNRLNFTLVIVTACIIAVIGTILPIILLGNNKETVLFIPGIIGAVAFLVIGMLTIGFGGKYATGINETKVDIEKLKTN